MTTYYEKRGRRYFPVAESNTWDWLPAGTFLVTVNPGSRSWMRLVRPATPEAEAAMKIAYDAMVKAMQEANAKMEPSPKKSPEEDALAMKAFAAYCAVIGPDRMLSYRGVSMHDVVAAGIEALRERMKNDAR